ncbi:hypothetical protein [Aeromicrobium sp. UC242_57]|uniref:hypothetical protein n=1 Tax=Aeromicrobium sp. UC242_57 TaxID=3374624 RepID=UPI0037B46822
MTKKYPTLMTPHASAQRDASITARVESPRMPSASDGSRNAAASRNPTVRTAAMSLASFVNRTAQPMSSLGSSRPGVGG